MMGPNGKPSRILLDYTTKSGVYGVYVQTWVLNTQSPNYKYKESGALLSPQCVELAKSFMPKPSSNKEHQGLEKEVIIRTYKIDNIVKIHIGKQKFIVS